MEVPYQQITQNKRNTIEQGRKVNKRLTYATLTPMKNTIASKIQSDGSVATDHRCLPERVMRRAGVELSLGRNDSILRVSRGRPVARGTDGVTVIVHDYMVDRDYHALGRDRSTGPHSHSATGVLHVRATSAPA